MRIEQSSGSLLNDMRAPYDRPGSGLNDANGAGRTELIAQTYNAGRYEFTGNQGIDAVLIGSRWTPSTLTFSFPTSGAFYGGYPANTEPAGHVTFNAAQQAAARRAIDLIESYTNLNIVEAAETSTTHANLRFSQTSFSNVESAYANFPSSSTQAGDIWFGRNDQAFYLSPAIGNWGMATMMHEIGHALGLKHGHQDYTFVDLAGEGYLDGPPGGGARRGSVALPANQDGQDWSLMTYRSDPSAWITFQGEGFNQPQTYMMYDIAALQHLYGADFTTNSGNTTYRWSATTGEMSINGVGQGAPTSNKISMTVWDGNGIDTYDLSNYAVGLAIDLTPGAFSRFDPAQRVNHQALTGGTAVAVGNVANALLYRGDLRSLIENAIGGSGNDRLLGNLANNTLIGNAGSDTLLGVGGNDVLNGGGGIDQLDGGEGVDRAIGGEGADWVAGGAGNDSLYGEAGDDTAAGGLGNDYVTGGLGNDRYVFRRGDGSDQVFDDNAVATSAAADLNAARALGVHAGDIVNTWSNGFLWNASLGRLYKLADSGTDTLALEGGIKAEDLSMSWTSNGDLAIDISGGPAGERIYITQQGVAASRIEKIVLDGLGTMGFGVSRGSGGLLQGGAGADLLFGLTGNDRIYGLDGNDIIHGKGGADALYGFGGDDTVAGGIGDDYVTGGLGNDRYVFRRGDGSDQVFDDNSVATTAASDLNAARAVGVHAGGIVNTWSNGFLWNASLGRLYKLTDSGTDTLALEGGIKAEDLSMSWTSNGDLAIDIAGGPAGERVYITQQGVAASRIEKIALDVWGTMNFAVAKANGSVAGHATEGRLLFGASGNETLVGGTGDDILSSGAGNDRLSGGGGFDWLIGGAGADTFVFNTALGEGNIDLIIDLKVADDTIELDDAIFSTLALGQLAANAFTVNDFGATDRDDRIIYEPYTGRLYYDYDGTGFGGSVVIGNVGSRLALTAADFVVV